MKDQSGNALWFILLAIALLAALSVTIGRSSDTTEQGNNFERQRVQFSDIVRYSTGIGKAVEQMRIRGLSENDISFENDVTTADYSGSPCADTHCRVFGLGGGQVYTRPPYAATPATEWLFSGANAVDGVGSAAPDLIMLLQVDQGICTQINQELGLGAVAQDAGGVNLGTPYIGAFAAGNTISTNPGKKVGCFRGNQDENAADISANYYFYHTLIAR